MDGGPLPPQSRRAVLAALYRYPVKGFSGQSLAEAALQPGRGIALDRCLGIANGHAVIPGEGWAPCQGFVRMTRNEGLPAYRLSLEEQGDGARLTLASPGGEHAVIDVAAPATWDAANRTIASWFPRGASTPALRASPGRPGLVGLRRRAAVTHQPGDRARVVAQGRRAGPAALSRQPVPGRPAGLARIRLGRTARVSAPRSSLRSCGPSSAARRPRSIRPARAPT